MWDPSPDTPDTQTYNAHPAIAQRLGCMHPLTIIKATPKQPTETTCGMAILITLMRIIFNPKHVYLPIYVQEDAQTIAAIIMTMVALQNLPANDIISRLSFLRRDPHINHREKLNQIMITRAPYLSYSPFLRLSEHFSFPPCPPTVFNIMRTLARIPDKEADTLRSITIRHNTLTSTENIAKLIQDATAPHAICYPHLSHKSTNVMKDIHSMASLPTTEIILILSYREAAAVVPTTEGIIVYISTTNTKAIPLNLATIPKPEAIIHVVRKQ
jgi:hypothetical protein